MTIGAHGEGNLNQNLERFGLQLRERWLQDWVLLLEWLPISCFEGDCERAPGKQDLSPGIYPAR